MDGTLLTAREIPHGYTWTLASRLGDMLTHAEEMFGERDKEYTILGIEYCDSGPRIWYPKSKKNIVIQLTPDALHSEDLAYYQLAHECIHLLSPSGAANANVLEEGIAVYFSWWYLKRVLNIEGYSYTKRASNYMTAGLFADKALILNPDFFRKARELYPEIWKITAREIHALCPQLENDEAELLAMPFRKSVINTERSYNSQA
jgi:hypothetical protein